MNVMVLCPILATFEGLPTMLTSKAPDVARTSLTKDFRALLESPSPANLLKIVLLRAHSAPSWSLIFFGITVIIFYGASPMALF